MIPPINFFEQYYYNLINYVDNWIEPRLTIDYEELLSLSHQAMECIISLVLKKSAMLTSLKDRHS